MGWGVGGGTEHSLSIVKVRCSELLILVGVKRRIKQTTTSVSIVQILTCQLRFFFLFFFRAFVSFLNYRLNLCQCSVDNIHLFCLLCKNLKCEGSSFAESTRLKVKEKRERGWGWGGGGRGGTFD